MKVCQALLSLLLIAVALELAAVPLRAQGPDPKEIPIPPIKTAAGSMPGVG